MGNFRAKIKKEEFDSLKQNCTIAYNAKTNRTFMYLPYWFEVISESHHIVDIGSLNDGLPKELTDILTK